MVCANPKMGLTCKPAASTRNSPGWQANPGLGATFKMSSQFSTIFPSLAFDRCSHLAFQEQPLKEEKHYQYRNQHQNCVGQESSPFDCVGSHQIRQRELQRELILVVYHD